MRSPDPLTVFWDMAQLESPVLTYDDLMRMPGGTRDALLATGLLVPHRTAQCIVCDDCESGHAEEVESVRYPNGVTHLFIYCPENGRIEIEPERLRQWRPRYDPVAALIADSFDMTGVCRDVVPDRLWDIGRAAIAGQSRPVWLARRVTADLVPRLPDDKVSVLFILGVSPRDGIAIAPERVFEIRRLVSVSDAGLALDADAVHAQLEHVVRSTPRKKTRRKRAPRANAADALRKVLRDQALMRKSARKRDWHAELPPLTQRELAEAAGVSEPTLSRILNDDSPDRDKEVQLLWQIVNNPEDLMRYHG